MNKNLYPLPLVILFVFVVTNNLHAGESRKEVETFYNTNDLRVSATVPLTQSAALQTPEIHADTDPEQTTIYLSFIDNPNEGSMTEIFRSTSRDNGYALINTIPAEQGEYEDPDLKPRTTYYYRLRAVQDGQSSGLSAPYAYTTYSISYRPDLTAKALNENTIELTFTDNSYNDDRYFIFGEAPEENHFFQEAIMPDSGSTVTFVHHPVNPGTTYQYTVRMETIEDQEPVEFAANASATTPGSRECAGIGSIEREVWTGIEGYSVSSIPVNDPPDEVTDLTIFETPQYDGNNYGARVRGYVCIPQTGNYTFWIASDDNSELWLSTDDDPANKVKIASVPGHTGFRQWTKYASQESAAISLEGGRRYFIEALHKEASGGDHLSIGWQLPDGTMERPIPGMRLIKFDDTPVNRPPVVNITSPEDGQTFAAPASITITAEASDSDGKICDVGFYNGDTFLGSDDTAPYSFQWNNVPPGTYTIVAEAFDCARKTTDAVSITVTEGACAGTGKIVREVWTNISGTEISSVPFNTAPDNRYTYTSFETPQYFGNNYGSRMRGYVCVPSTGNYTFWIASDDKSELWLSTDENPANKVKIAAVTGYTSYRQWDKYTTQESAAINLVAGRKYYIEALHKEAGGNDHISVGWQLPGGSLERPIPGNRLIQHEGTLPNKAPEIVITSPQPDQNFTSPASVRIAADVTDPDGTITRVKFDVLYGHTSTTLAEFTSSPYEFQWNDVPSGSYQLIVSATDDARASTSKILFFSVDKTEPCSGSGKIMREIWTGISGTSVSSIPVNSTPDEIVELVNFETQNYYGNDYGSRIRGYVCAPASGAYTFWIASDDNSELWLSSNADPANKAMIASVSGYTGVLQWDKYQSQQSPIINLVEGQQYYIEVLHKEAGGADHVAVGWQLPGGTLERPLPGNRLIPFENTENATRLAAADDRAVDNDLRMIDLYPNPTSAREVTLSIFSENIPEVREADVQIMSFTGELVYDGTVSLRGDYSDILLTLRQDAPPGLYLVKVDMNGKQISKKLLIK